MLKTVLVTGANRGLGLSLVKTFLHGGHRVFAGVYKGVDTSQIDAVTGQNNLHILDLDVSDTDSVWRAASELAQYTDALDIIVSNAGIISQAGIEIPGTIFDKLDYDEILRVYNVNAVGALRVGNAFSPFLQKGEDKLLVNISSEAGSIGSCWREGWFGYCMSKAALNMAGAIAHNALRKIGGQVLQIHPGWVQSYMSGTKNEKADYSPDYAAEQIFSVIMSAEIRRGDKAVYLDLFGNPLEW